LEAGTLELEAGAPLAVNPSAYGTFRGRPSASASTHIRALRRRLDLLGIAGAPVARLGAGHVDVVELIGALRLSENVRGRVNQFARVLYDRRSIVLGRKRHSL
jgi:hypothetical protein